MILMLILSRMTWNQKGDPVLHIELRRWADIILVAPASANTIAKAANGICDNLVLCTIRAWDHSRPAICCPAMNSYMLDHPSLSLHLTHLKSFGFQILESDVKTLACGDVGKGALASVSEIVGACRLAVSSLPAENPERYLEKQAAQDVIKSILRADVGRSHHASFIVPTNILSKTVAVVSIFLLGYLFGMYNTRANKNK